MTDLNVTQADRNIAIELCSEDWDAHAVIDADTEEGTCCIECGPIAAALTKVRKEEQAKTDEAVAAVVEECCRRFCSKCEKGIPFCTESNLRLAHKVDKGEDPTGWVICEAYRIREEHPNAQQILAERDKRVEEEAQKDMDFHIEAAEQAEFQHGYTHAKEDAAAQQRELRGPLMSLYQTTTLWVEDGVINGRYLTESEKDMLDEARQALGEKG